VSTVEKLRKDIYSRLSGKTLSIMNNVFFVFFLSFLEIRFGRKGCDEEIRFSLKFKPKFTIGVVAFCEYAQMEIKRAV